MPPVAVARISELPALPILKKNLSGRSNPVHTPFSEFVDCTVAAELYTTYDESMSAKSLAAQQDHCGSGPQSYDPADFPPDILWAPAPEVVTPSATSGYRKLAEPLADWVAGYVWTACSTGFSLPSAFSQSLTIVKQRSRSPPSHLANAVHSLLLSTVLQPSAVFLAAWYIARLPVYYDAAPLSADYVKEARFRAVLLGNGLDQDVMEASAPFRLIVLGFMLANKWLDVHTFSNKIWHTISNVPIATLNKLESLTLDIFAYNLSVPSSDWRQWLSHLVSYHQLYSPLHLQPISRPSTNPRPIVLLALNEIIQATAACNFNSACPQPVFIGIGGRRRERMEKEQARSVDVLEIDSDEDGPLREEYMPKRRIRCAGRKASEYARIKDLHQISVRLFEKHSIPLGTTNNGAPLQEVSMNNVLPPFYPEPSSGGGNLHRGSFGAPTQPPNKRSFLGLPNWGGPSSDFLTLDTDVSLWRSNSEVFQHRKASFGPGSAEHGSGSRTSQQLRPYPSPNVSTYMHSRDGSSLFASSPQGVNNGDMYAIIHRLDRLFQDKKGSYVKFLARCGASAQRLLDVLQDLLDYDSKFATMNKRRLFKALIRLSGDTRLHPRCCMLTGLELGEHLGGGSFSDVYKGSLCNQTVAIKMMRVFGKRNIDTVLKEFGREALIWRQLSHPNLLPFFGLYYLQNRLCLVSPWMENGSLQAFLKESEDSFSPDHLISWILDVALGLQYMHDKDVVHGDLKAENIFVTPSFRACIADFGLSSIITTLSSLQLTNSSQRAQGGTIRYQAPELHRGGHNDLRSDIYAFACVAYHVLTGKLPFPELRTDGAVINAVLEGRRPLQPLSYSRTPLLDGLWILLRDCWEELPERRPTAVQIIERLMGPVIQAKTVESATDWDNTFTSRFRRSVLGQPTLPSVAELEHMIFGHELADGENSVHTETQTSI